MSLNGRVTKLEARLTVPETGTELHMWARFFMESRMWPDVGDDTAETLEEDREASREFVAACQGIGMMPSIAALDKMEHQQGELD